MPSDLQTQIQQLMHQNNWPAAANLCQQLIAQEPQNPQSLRLAAFVTLRVGQPQQAASLLEQCIRLSPGDAKNFKALSSAYSVLGKLAEAEQALKRANELLPNDAQILRQLGDVYVRLHRGDPAGDAYAAALALRPDDIDLMTVLASIRDKQDRFDEALQLFDAALSKQPDHILALRGKAHVFQRTGRLDESKTILEQILSRDPDHTWSRFDLSAILLLRGEFDKGWREYESRFKLPHLREPKYPEPRWDGSPLAGKSIRLAAEQGFGDTIQFVRFAKTFADQGARCVLRCQPELESLLSRTPGVASVAAQGLRLEPCDCYVPLLSIPMILKTTVDTIPANIPYVLSDPAATQRMAHLFPPRDRKTLHVGLCWSGRPTHGNDRHRSIESALLSPLAQVSGVRFFDLHIRDVRPPPGLQMISLKSSVHNFADTAAIVEQLDLVISVDTSIAHLAGAMGKRVWTLLPWIPDCRWMLDRPDSPWYPTMRLFRQKQFGQWQPVIDEVTGELQKFVRSNRPGLLSSLLGRSMKG